MSLIDKIYNMQNWMYKKQYVQARMVFMNKATYEALKKEAAPFTYSGLPNYENDSQYTEDMIFNMEVRIDENLADNQILLSE